MTKAFKFSLIILFGALFALQTRADLTHRYSFTNDASDSVGNANGAVNGTAVVSGGLAFFDGSPGSFIELPPGIISNYTSVTFDFWIDVGAQVGNWAELYAFGDRDTNGNGSHMLMFTPHSGNNDYRMSFADADPGFNDEYVVTQPGVLDNLGPIHITCVYNPTNSFMGLYTNGVLAASRSDLGEFFTLTSISNVHSWLGQSLYAPDAPYAGSIDELRIYNQALNSIEIAASNAGGPDNATIDPGALTALNLTTKTPLVKGAFGDFTLSADFAQVSGVSLTGIPGVSFSSSNTNVFTVDPTGKIVAVNAGSATLSVSYGGKSATQVINVTTGTPTTLTHRYNFASDANDSVGTANGTLLGGAFVDNGEVVLDGVGSYVEFPPDMLTNYDSITFEAWVTDQGSAGWARIWDFGDSDQGPGNQGLGTKYMFLSLPSGFGNLRGSYTATGGGPGEQVVEWPGGRPAVGQKSHIVWTSDVSFQTGRLYVNGSLVGVNTNMTLSPRDIGSTFNDWLGRSQFNDPFFNGSIDEFRIYNGAITPLQAALDAATGPENTVTNVGALKALQLTFVGTNSVVAGSYPSQVELLANFENVSNVNVSTLEGTIFQSGNSNIVSVSPSGVVTGLALSNTVLTASYGGMTSTVPVTVTAPFGYTNSAALAHRYSFNDAPGSTTVKDSAGGADGVIAGAGAVLGNGQLTLPGGTSSSADPSTIAGYVDLPNHIISVLPDISIEAWVTWQGSGAWQRIFDFGTSQTGEDVSDGMGSYLFLTPQRDSGVMEFSVRDPSTGAEPAPLNAPSNLAANQETYLAVVYDYSANLVSLYSNAVLIARTTAPVDIGPIDDVNNWLGRSQWPDPMFKGKYDEFRIWDGVLLPGEIATHYAAGPDALTATPGVSLSVSRSGSSVVLSWPASATGFTLQSTPQLGTGATWTPVGTAPTTANGVSTVTLPITTGNQFFRLTK